MTAPTKINSGNGRTVSRADVLKADDPAVEREQLNRILKSLDARLYLAEQAIDEVEASSSSSSGESVDLSNLSVDTTQLDYQPIGGGAYYLNIAAGGVGTLELADEAVTTAKIDDEAVTTAKIDDDAVTFAKMQNIATDRLIGRDTAASGSPEEISLDDTLEFTGTGSIQRAALTGDITATAGSNATTLATVNANVGSFGAADETLSLTLDGKGRVTAASSQAIAIAYTQVSGLGTVVTYDVGTSGGTVPLLNGNNTHSGTNSFTGGLFGGTATSASAQSNVAGTFTPTVQANATSGTAGYGVIVNDGTRNRRASLFMDDTNNVFGIANTWSSGGNGTFKVGAVTTEYFRATASMLTAAGGVTCTTLNASTTITATGTASGVGYATGAGGTVTQATDKSTGVTLNRPSGTITMNGAALAADTIVSFTLTNSTIAATDVLILNHSSVGTLGAYTLNATCAAGSAQINVRNNTAGSLSEAIVIRFALIKGVTS